MSASVKIRFGAKSFTQGKKRSNNAKRNRQLNRSHLTAAQYFYLHWGQ